jgi:hypothetical protein
MREAMRQVPAQPNQVEKLCYSPIRVFVAQPMHVEIESNDVPNRRSWVHG